MLYHYTNKEAYEKYIEPTKLLRFSSPVNKNTAKNYDPADFASSYELIISIFTLDIKKFRDDEVFVKFINYVRTDLINKASFEKVRAYVLKNILSLSCCKDSNNLFLKQEYAQNDGYIIEINEEEIIKRSQGCIYKFDVVYVDFEKYNNSLDLLYDKLYEVFAFFTKEFAEMKYALELETNLLNYFDDLLYKIISHLIILIKNTDKNQDKEKETRLFVNINDVRSVKIFSFGGCTKYINTFEFHRYFHYLSHNDIRIKKICLNHSIRTFDYLLDKYKLFFKSDLNEVFTHCIKLPQFGHVENTTSLCDKLNLISEYYEKIDDNFYIDTRCFVQNVYKLG